MITNSNNFLLIPLIAISLTGCTNTLDEIKSSVEERLNNLATPGCNEKLFNVESIKITNNVNGNINFNYIFSTPKDITVPHAYETGLILILQNDTTKKEALDIVANQNLHSKICNANRFQTIYELEKPTSQNYLSGDIVKTKNSRWTITDQQFIK